MHKLTSLAYTSSQYAYTYYSYFKLLQSILILNILMFFFNLPQPKVESRIQVPPESVFGGVAVASQN